MSFETLQLNPAILRAVANCGYSEPTPIQARAIPEILAGRDLLANAQTGTGKTAAFMLPVLERLSEVRRGPKGTPRVLVVTPTRELAAQVTEATRNYGRFINLRSAVILGGTPYVNQYRDLGGSIDLVVGTPGRLIDHLERRSLNLSRLEVLILDEADRMLDMGFKEDMEKLVAASPLSRQTLLFTATLDTTMAELAGTAAERSGAHRHRRQQGDAGADRTAPACDRLPRAQEADPPPPGRRPGGDPGHRLLRHQARCRRPGHRTFRPGAPCHRAARRHAAGGAQPRHARLCARGGCACWWPPTSPPAGWMSTASAT